jgi:curli biogenesis system outer membrane secretion channel CsgG
VAVLDLAGNNISQETTRAVSDLLSSYLWETGRFRVLERQDIAQAIQEMGWSEDGAWVCDEVSCAVDIGKSLKIAHVIIGSVSLFEDLATVSIRVVDVESREVVAARTVKSEEGVRGIPDAVQRIAELMAQSFPQ